MDTNAIADRIVLAYVHLSVWTGAKRDKEATKRTARSNGAADDACSVTKYLVDKTMIDHVMNKANYIRQFHYKNTVAWDDAGGRALPISKFFDYKSDIEQLITDFNHATRQFCEWYANNWNQQRDRLGDLFSADEYPHPEDIKNKFKFKSSFRNISTPDFRTALPDTILQEVKDSIDIGFRDGLAMATKECWGRIAEAMEKVYSTLEEEKKVFRDSLLDNVSILCQTIRPLNISGDSLLEQTITEIENHIVDTFPDLLRVRPDERRKVALKAKEFYERALLQSR